MTYYTILQLQCIAYYVKTSIALSIFMLLPDHNLHPICSQLARFVALKQAGDQAFASMFTSFAGLTALS